jgi:predicted dehydrogenase
MSDEPLRIGIAGVGGIAESHMAALRSTSGATLVAVCDVVAERATQIGAREGCAAYGSLAELLADPAVEAVICCTPNLTHEELGHQILAAGKHLLMEKPLAMTPDGARALQADAAARGLTLMAGHSHRFSDQSLALRETIDSGAIGTPRFVRIAMNGGWIWPGWQHWVLNPELSGGHSFHNGVHLTDLAAWLLGEQADSVFSAGQHATSEALQIFDYLVVGLGFPSGASAVCEISRGDNPRNASYLEITVVGTEGVVSREWDAEGVLAWLDHGMSQWGLDGIGARTFVREMEAFADAVRGRKPVEPPVAFAVHAVDVAAASEESLVTGQTIRIGGAA